LCDDAAAIEKASRDAGVVVFSAKLYRTVEEEQQSDSESDMIEERDGTPNMVPAYTLRTIKDIDGSLVASSAQTAADYLLEVETSNDYDVKHPRYKQVVIIAPRRAEFLLQIMDKGEPTNSESLSYLAGKMQSDPNCLSHRSDLVLLCTKIIEAKEGKLRSNISESQRQIAITEPIVGVVQACANLGETKLLQRVLQCFHAGPPLTFFSLLARIPQTIPFADIEEGYAIAYTTIGWC
jgi:hypothetical protein